MTTAFAGTPSLPNTPTLPNGWPIGSYDNYADAQRAVDHLADKDFPVADLTIVGIDPMLVERVAARLTWSRVLTRAAMSGAWFGLLVGLLLSMFTPGGGLLPILLGLTTGIAFSTVFAAVAYRASRGRRDFTSTSQLVARRYDVLCTPRNAERGRDLLAELELSAPPAW